MGSYVSYQAILTDRTISLTLEIEFSPSNFMCFEHLTESAVDFFSLVNIQRRKRKLTRHMGILFD